MTSYDNTSGPHAGLRIPREEAFRLGHEMVRIIELGSYTSPAGREIAVQTLAAEAVRGTVTYPQDVHPGSPAAGSAHTTIAVRNETTLAAAQALIATGLDVAALNFASATEPGGGFLNGARAQEEYLARSSGLYACLHGNPMYDHHRGRPDPLYSDYLIYSPAVPILRDDTGRLLETPWTCGIITSPAVQANAVRMYAPAREPEISAVMARRVDKVLAVAAHHRHTGLILGAWGCGAFGNGPATIAALFKDALSGPFQRAFAAG